MYDRNVIRVCNIDYDYVCVDGMTRILSTGFSFKWRENDYQFLDYNYLISTKILLFPSNRFLKCLTTSLTKTAILTSPMHGMAPGVVGLLQP